MRQIACVLQSQYSFLLKFLLSCRPEQSLRNIQLCGTIMEARQYSHDGPLGKLNTLIMACTPQGSFTGACTVIDIRGDMVGK